MDWALYKIVENEVNSFVEEYQITDFPKLEHVLAMIDTESQWHVNADSGFQRGLMQVSQQAVQTVNKLYSKNFQYTDMFDPAKNVYVGVRYMRWLYRYFTSTLKFPPVLQIPLTIMQYNWGVGNVVKWLRDTKQCNSAIDEAVPAETKSHFLNWLFWCIVRLQEGK